MAIITLGKTWVDLEKVYFSDINNNFQAIYNDHNGNITDANVAAGAAINPTKISGTAMTLASTDTITGIKTFSKQLTVAEVATPTVPSSGVHQLYFKADGKLYVQNSAGLEVSVSSGNLQALLSTTTLTNAATSSATDVVMMTQAVTTTGITNILVSPTFVWQQSNNSGTNYADVYLDGALASSANFIQKDFTANGKNDTAHGEFAFTNVAAGAHTVDIRYRVGSNTTTASVTNGILLCKVFNA